jgi:hypothetical protein
MATKARLPRERQDSSQIYRVEVVGPIPADLTTRISHLHAVACEARLMIQEPSEEAPPQDITLPWEWGGRT